MELNTLLAQQITVLEDILACLKKEKEALIKEDAKMLLDIIEEKKQLMDMLNQVEKKREEIYPGINITKLKEAGLLTEELREAGQRIKELVKSIQDFQETNQLLTRQSLLYVNKMISILKGSCKSTYDEQGKLGQEGKKSFLDQTI